MKIKVKKWMKFGKIAWLFSVAVLTMIPHNLFAENSRNVISIDDILMSTESGQIKPYKLNGNEYSESLRLLKEGKTFEAREILSHALFADIYKSRRSEIKRILDDINQKLVFSRQPSPFSFIYTVKGGDTLAKIAKNFATSHELIMLINEKYRSNIRIGEHLKIFKGPFDVLIDKSDFELTVLLNGHYIKQYRVGTGKDNKTPVGAFEIAEMLKEPVWYSGDGVFPFGHPKNILGTRWIGFKDKPGLYGYGIHGTAFPESIGKSESNGCIRLKNEDVQELYSFITKGSKVTIRE